MKKLDQDSTVSPSAATTDGIAVPFGKRAPQPFTLGFVEFENLNTHDLEVALNYAHHDLIHHEFPNDYRAALSTWADSASLELRNRTVPSFWSIERFEAFVRETKREDYQPSSEIYEYWAARSGNDAKDYAAFETRRMVAGVPHVTVERFKPISPEVLANNTDLEISKRELEESKSWNWAKYPSVMPEPLWLA